MQCDLLVIVNLQVFLRLVGFLRLFESARTVYICRVRIKLLTRCTTVLEYSQNSGSLPLSQASVFALRLDYHQCLFQVEFTICKYCRALLQRSVLQG